MRSGRSGLLGALLLACHPCLHAQEAADEPVEFPYVVVPEDAINGHLMKGLFKEPVGVYFDQKARELFVADSKNGLIGIFNPGGTPLFAFGGPSFLTDPKYISVTADGTIHVVDANELAVHVFSYRGEPQETIQFYQETSEGGDREPVRVRGYAMDAKENHYVVSMDPPRILIFDRDLALRQEIRPAEDEKKYSFTILTSIAVSSEGLIAVTDFKGAPVQLFDAEGRFLRSFGRRDISLEGFSAPVAAAFDAEGYLYVVDMLRHDVKIFDVRKGNLAGHFGGWYSPATRGRGPGEMLYPSSICIDPKGFIYVAERYGNRVQMFLRLTREEFERNRQLRGRK